MATPRTRLGAEHAACEEENPKWMIPGPTGRITGTLLDNLGTFYMQAMLGFGPSQRIALLSKVPRICYQPAISAGILQLIICKLSPVYLFSNETSFLLTYPGI
jgi:hypothetical protein